MGLYPAIKLPCYLQEEGITLREAAAKEAAGTANDKERRLLAVSQKQDRLMYLCAYLLLNLSEDPDIERKMQKKVGPPLVVLPQCNMWSFKQNRCAEQLGHHVGQRSGSRCVCCDNVS